MENIMQNNHYNDLGGKIGKETFDVQWASNIDDCDNMYCGIFSTGNAKNRPVDYWCTILSLPMNGNSSYNAQIAFTSNDSHLYFRYSSNGAYRPWREI